MGCPVAQRVERCGVAVQAHDLEARSGQKQGVPTRAAGHVEDAAPRGEEVGVVEQPGRRRLARARRAREGALEIHGARLGGDRGLVNHGGYNPPAMSALLETVEVEPKVRAEASVVWLHGLGADGHDFESLVPELRLPPRPAIRFVFPHAPVRPVTINAGWRMRAWYDIAGLDRNAPQDAEGIRASAAEVRALLARERERGVAAERTVLAGFSQGGAIALFEGLRQPERLGGILALSSYLPLADTLAAEAHPANAAVAILMAHGTSDPTVPLALGESSRADLEARGYTVEWHTYPMGHAVCAEEITDVRRFLLRVLA